MKEKTSNNTETSIESKAESVGTAGKWYIRIMSVLCISLLIFNFNHLIVMVNGSSMYPNYKDGNILISNRKFDEINRFDVVIINSDNAGKILIKRVIGLPGECIEYKNNHLYVDGEYIFDQYNFGNMDEFKVTLDENSYFCLGDNRNNSADSRYYGNFDRSEIIGLVSN